MSVGRIDTLRPMQPTPTPPALPKINHELRQLRLEAGLSQVQLAKLIGLDQSTISTVEKGASTTIHAWVSACKGQITVLPAKADPWQGVPDLLRPLAVEVAQLWCSAPEDVRTGILLALRGFRRQA